MVSQQNSRCRAWAGTIWTMAVVLVAAPGHAQDCTAPSFAWRSLQPHAGGTLPARQMVSADFNHDGNLDVAFAVAFGTPGVAVRLGSATGVLAAETIFPAGTEPLGLALGDFNRDGLLDIAVADFPNGVQVLEATGSGATFLPPVSYPVLAQVARVAVADFDHDGALDIVVGTGAVGTTDARLITGDGDGTFTDAGAVAVGTEADQIAAGDLTRDGHVDLVVVSKSGDEVRVVSGNGDGTFATPMDAISVIDQPGGITLADWNGDGDLDVAVTGTAGAPRVSVLFGDGSGDLTSRTDYVASNPPVFSIEEVRPGDFDGDGDLDMAVGFNSTSRMSVLLNDGTGAFGSPVEFTTSASLSFALTVGDFNRDGRLDVVTSNATSSYLSVFLNDFGEPCEDPSFGPAPQRIAGDSVVSIARGDWDGDGFDDLFAVDGTDEVMLFLGEAGTFVPTYALRSGLGEPVQILATPGDPVGIDLLIVDQGANEIRVLAGDGAGNITSDYGRGVGTSPVAAVLGNFDSDGVVDLAVANYGSADVTVLRSLGAGTATISIPTSMPRGLAAGDFEENGIADLLVADENGPIWLVPKWPGGWLPPTSVANVGVGASHIVAGHFNSDSSLDAAVTNSLANQVVILFGDGSGGFSVSGSYSVPTEPRGLAVVDLDGDGALDLVVASFANGQSWVLRGLGNGTFATPVSYATGGGSQDVLAEDLTGDGLPDIAVGGYYGIHILPGSSSGDGTPAQPHRPALTEEPTGAGLGDLDGDGDLDLVALAAGSDTVLVAAGAGDGTFAAASSYPVGNSPGDVVVRDVNGDGYPDLVTSNSLSGDVSVLINAGGRSGTFGLPAASYGANDRPGPIAAADFDRNGTLDLVVLNVEGSAQTGVTILLGAGDGTFAAPAQIDTTNRPAAVAVADVNRDGDPDLIVTFDIPGPTSDYFRPFLGDGDGTFTPGDTVAFSTQPFVARAVVVADFDRNGTIDVAAGAGRILAYQGDGLGGFTFWATMAMPNGVVDLALGDWNRDGRLQLAASEGTASSVAFTPPVGSGEPVRFRYGTRAATPQAPIVAGDLNNDGRTDLVAVERTSGANSIAVLLNTNCLARRLTVVSQVPGCATPSATLDPQPTVGITDDAANTLSCASTAADAVTASLLPNAFGGALLGTPTQTPDTGEVDFVGLGVSAPGRGYRLGFSHPTAGVARSRAFSQGVNALAFGISGPALVCQEEAPYLYRTLDGFDTYSWTLDSPPPLPSDGSTAFLAFVPAGLHTLNVAVTQDGCSGAATPFEVTSAGSLLWVTATPTGSTWVAPSGTAGSVTATPGGGGSSSYQWHYQASDGGPIHDIGAATTDPTYVITGADFDGGTVGTYDLFVTGTPACGTPVDSNRVEVSVYTATSDPDAAVRFLVATAWDDRITLEWIHPPNPFDAIQVRYTAGAGCAAPAGLDEGVELVRQVGGTADGKGSATDSGPGADETRCYSVFAEYGGPTASLARSMKVRTIAPTEDALWAYSTGAAAMTQPGVGNGVVYAVSNDGLLHSVVGGGAGGLWPSTWRPKELLGVSEGRPTAVPLGFSGSSSTLFVTSSDATTGAIYALDAETGAELWADSPGAPVQAAPSGLFAAYGGAVDLIFVCTRTPPGSTNSLRAWSPRGAPGAVAFVGEDGNRVGQINGQPSVDYAGGRIYFGSHEFEADHDTVWCVDAETLTSCAGWDPPSFGNTLPDNDVEASPIPRGATLLVAPVDGTVRGLSMDDGSEKWSFATGDGVVKGHVFPDHASSAVFFSTNGIVWCRTEATGALDAKWSVTTITNPSPPVFVQSRGEVWVGSGDGRLYRLDSSDGTELAVYDLADGSTQIGSPTIHRSSGHLYVGAEDGRVFAVPLPVVP